MVAEMKNIVLEGHARKADELKELNLPFNVPVGTTSINLKFSYSGKDNGNAIDLGLLGVDKVFRGYSGGSKSEVLVANNEATPGYIPGLLGPGEWYVLLAVYSIKETSSYRIEISLGNDILPVFVPHPAPTRVVSTSPKRPFGSRASPKWLKGDFHMHTLYSDGKFTLDELAKKAQDRGLDFIFSTEHNTFSANEIWGKYAPPNLLVGRGIEVTTRMGHWNAIGLLPDQFINPRTSTDEELRQAVAEVHQQDGFAIINHPYGECKCCDWSFSFIEEMDAIEVWNGPWKRHPEDQSNEQAVAKWDSLLREGKWFVATGGSDIHEPQYDIGEPCTHVLAEEVSTSAIIRGLRHAGAYMTQHPSYEIEFKLRSNAENHYPEDDRGQIDNSRFTHSAGIGESITAKRAIADVVLTGFPDGAVLEIITDRGVQTKCLATRGRWTVDGRYVRIEVRAQDGSMLGLTNPIWINT